MYRLLILGRLHRLAVRKSLIMARQARGNEKLNREGTVEMDVEKCGGLFNFVFYDFSLRLVAGEVAQV